MACFKLLAPFFFVVFFCLPSSATTLEVNSNGILLGAFDVMVNGEMYDVEFKDGLPMDLFTQGSTWGFTFTSSDDAYAASQSLLNFVFLDTTQGLFDSIPYLTNGAVNNNIYNEVSIWTPWRVTSDYIHIGITTNNLSIESDRIGLSAVWTSYDTTLDDTVTYAVWTKSTSTVPEPGTLFLLGGGLLILLGRIRKRI